APDRGNVCPAGDGLAERVDGGAGGLDGEAGVVLLAGHGDTGLSAAGAAVAAQHAFGGRRFAFAVLQRVAAYQRVDQQALGGNHVGRGDHAGLHAGQVELRLRGFGFGGGVVDCILGGGHGDGQFAGGGVQRVTVEE